MQRLAHSAQELAASVPGHETLRQTKSSQPATPPRPARSSPARRKGPAPASPARSHATAADLARLGLGDLPGLEEYGDWGLGSNVGPATPLDLSVDSHLPDSGT